MKVSMFAKKLAKDEIKQNKFYIGVLSFAIFIMIVFMHLVIEGTMKPNTDDFLILIANSFPYLLAIIASVMAILMVYYANELYLLSHQKELGLISVCGGKASTVAKYVATQNLMFMAYGLPIALLASFVALPILQMLSNVLLDASTQMFSFKLEAYLYTLLVLCIMITALLIGNVGFIYRHDIKELLGFYKAHDTFKIDYPLKKLLSIITCILPLLGIWFLPAGIMLDFGFLIFAVFSVSGFLCNVVISILRKIQHRHYLHRHKTIVYAHVSEMLNNNLGPIKLVNAAVMPIPLLLLFYQEDTHMLVLVFTFYIASLCMSGICLQHRLSETVIQQQDDIRCLMNIGYDEIDIRHIVRNEVKLYYMIVFMIPIIYISSALIKSYVYNLVSIELILIIMISLLIFIFLNIVLSNLLNQHYAKKTEGECVNG